MKKKAIFPALLTAVSLFAFSGCGGSSSDADAEAAKPLNEISADVRNCGVEFPEMIEVSEDNFQDKYELSADDYEEYSLWWAGSSMEVDEVCIIKAKDVKKVKNAVSERLDGQKDVYEGYAPEQYDKLCKTNVKTKGKYVYWLCTNDNDKAEKALEDDFK